jgi:hypothetical protein
MSWLTIVLVFAGYRFHPNWVTEANYTDLGDVTVSTTANVPSGESEAYAQALLDSISCHVCTGSSASTLSFGTILVGVAKHPKPFALRILSFGKT